MNHKHQATAARICIGKIATAHGIRGLVKVLVYAEDPHLLEGARYSAESGPDTISLTMKNSMGKYWLAAVDGVSDRNSAEALRGTTIWMDRAELPEAEEGAFYYDDLVGLDVIDSSGQPAGTVIAVENFGAGDLLEIQPPGAESYYLPFNDDTVPEVDIKSGTITIADHDYR